jgi:hypothetical protein
MNRKLIGIAVLSVMAMSFFFGCQSVPEPPKPPNEVIRDAFENSRNVKAHTYEIAADADITGEGEQLKFNVLIGGVMDINDSENPVFSMKLKGSVSDGKEMGGSADGELRMNKDAIFLNVADVGVEGEELPTEFTEMFGKWYNIPLTPEDSKELQESLALGADEELTPEQEELLAMVEEMFTEPKYTGTENIKGETSWVYEVSLDTEALIDVMKKYAESQGTPVSQEEIDETRRSLKDVSVSGKLWVGTSSNVITQILINLTLRGDGEETPAGTISFRATLGDIGKAQSIQVPAGAEEFPMEMLMGPLMMMGGMTPSLSEEDLSGMEDIEFSEEDMAELEAMMSELEGLEGMEIPE